MYALISCVLVCCQVVYYPTKMPTIKVMAGTRLATALMNVADVTAILSKYKFCPNESPAMLSYVLHLIN